MSDHVSDLQMDRLLASELASDSRDAAHAHVEGCARCNTRLRELAAERDAFKLRPVGFSLARPAPRRRWWWGLSLVPVAAAVGLVLFVRGRPPDQTERVKGTGPALLLSAGRPGVLAPLAAGDTIHPGDYLQAGYTTNLDGFGAVLSRDSEGTAMAYVPPFGDAMVALPAGTERSFPQSTVLDDAVGNERIVVVWCEAARSITPLLADLRARGEVAAPTGCFTRLLMLDKRVVSP